MLMPVGVHILFLVGLISGLLGAVGSFGLLGIVNLLGSLVLEVDFGLLAVCGLIMTVSHLIRTLKKMFLIESSKDLATVQDIIGSHYSNTQMFGAVQIEQLVE
jgi:hypothetical protein